MTNVEIKKILAFKNKLLNKSGTVQVFYAIIANVKSEKRFVIENSVLEFDNSFVANVASEKVQRFKNAERVLEDWHNSELYKLGV